MSTNSKETGGGTVVLYFLLACLVLYIVWLILKFIYYALSYLSLNLFLGLDKSVYGNLTDTHWLGYTLFGAGLGAACGAIAAQRRYRLNKLFLTGGVISLAVLFSFIFIGNIAAESVENSTPDIVQVETQSVEEESETAQKSTVEPQIEETSDDEQSTQDVIEEVEVADTSSSYINNQNTADAMYTDSTTETVDSTSSF